MLKKEFKKGIITLHGTGMDRGKVLLGNEKGKLISILEDENGYDWGYRSARSKNLAYDILVAILEDPVQAKIWAGNFEAIVVSLLNPLKFSVKIHVRDLLEALIYPHNQEDGKTTPKAIKHAFSFIFFNISTDLNNPKFVSKFLDFINTASHSIVYGSKSIQYKLWMDLDNESKYMMIDYFSSQKKAKLIGGGISKVSVLVHEINNGTELNVVEGEASTEYANSLIYDYEKVFISNID